MSITKQPADGWVPELISNTIYHLADPNSHPNFLAHISWGQSLCANSVGFGIFPGVFELFVRCAKILFPSGGVCVYIFFEICEKRPFQKCMG